MGRSLNWFELLQRLWLQPAQRALLKADRQERLRNLAMLLAGLAFLGILYGVLKPIVGFMAGQDILGRALLLKGVSLVFSVLTLLTAISSVATAASRFFLDRDGDFLMVSPAPSRSLFRLKLAQAALSSGWMFLPIWLPLAMAIRHALHYSYAFVVWAVVAPWALQLMAASIGSALVLGLARIFSARELRRIFYILSGLLGLILVWVVRVIQPEKLADAEGAKSAAEFLGRWQAGGAWWDPGALAAKAVLSWPDPIQCLGAALGLWVAALLLLLGVERFFAPVYRSLWLSQREQDRQVASAAKPWLSRIWQPGLRPWAAWWLKEASIMVRDAGTRMQVLVLAALSGLFVYNLSHLPFGEDAGLRALLYLPALAFSQFIVIAVAARFVFTAATREAGSSWLVAVSPMGPQRSLVARFTFYLPWLLALDLALVAATAQAFKPDFWPAMAGWLTAIMTPLGLCSLSVGLGQVWAAEDSSKADELVTSFKGVAYSILTLAYVSIPIVILALPLREMYRLGLSKRFEPNYWALLVPMLAYLAIQIVAIWLPLRRALDARQQERLGH